MSDLQARPQAKKTSKQGAAAAVAAKTRTSAKAGCAKSPKGKKQLRKRRRRQMRAILALAGLIVVLLALCGWQFAEYKGFQQKRAAVDGHTFFEGVFVEGVDVSDMTLDEALDYWETTIEPAYASRTVTLSDGTQIVAEDVGYTSNYRQVLRAAYDACRTGGLEDQYQTLGGIGAGMDYSVSRSFCTREAL